MSAFWSFHTCCDALGHYMEAIYIQNKIELHIDKWLLYY